MEKAAEKNILWKKHLAIQDKHMDKLHRELGKLWSIPDCCVEQFVREQKYNIMSADFRQRVHQKLIIGIDYVPCDKCMEKL